MQRRQAPKSAFFGALAVLVVGCSSASADVSDMEPVSEGRPSIGVPHFDFNALTSTEELAKLSDVVVRGKIEKVAEGSEYGIAGDAVDDIPTVVIWVAGAEAVRGELRSVGDRIYIGVPGGVEMRKLLEIGSDVVAYGTWVEEKTVEAKLSALSPGAGRPAGENLAGLTNPQGLIVHAPNDDSLTWPMLGIRQAASLDDSLPGGRLIGVEAGG